MAGLRDWLERAGWPWGLGRVQRATIRKNRDAAMHTRGFARYSLEALQMIATDNVRRLETQLDAALAVRREVARLIGMKSEQPELFDMKRFPVGHDFGHDKWVQQQLADNARMFRELRN